MRTIISAAVIALLLCGCSYSPHLIEDFGCSSEAMFSAQVVTSDAPKDRTPVDGLPGDIAVKIYKKYKSGGGASFEQQLGDWLTGGGK